LAWHANFEKAWPDLKDKYQYLRHYVALTAPNRAILAAIC